MDVLSSKSLLYLHQLAVTGLHLEGTFLNCFQTENLKSIVNKGARRDLTLVASYIENCMVYKNQCTEWMDSMLSVH